MTKISVSDDRLRSCLIKLSKIMTTRWEQQCLALEPILARLEAELKEREQMPAAITRAQTYLNPNSSSHFALVSKLDPDP